MKKRKKDKEEFHLHLVFSIFLVDEPCMINLNFPGAQGTQLQRVLEMLTGQSTVPNVFIGNFLLLSSIF